MADSLIKIEGVHPLIDGEYPIDLTALTNRDFHDIKRIANLRSQEVEEGFEKGDTDLIVAFAVIALRHAGKPFTEDVLWDAPVGKLKLVDGDVEEAVEEALPPASPPPSVTPSGNGVVGGQSDAPLSSGLALISDAVAPENVPSPTGIQPSGAGVTSPLEMSAS